MKQTKLLFVGDLFVPLHTFKISEVLHTLFTECAIISCNLEAPFVKNSFLPVTKAGPTLAHPEKVSNFIKDLGFNLFSLANNHIYDYGVQGLKNTITLLSKENVVGAGVSPEDAYALNIKNINNTKVGFLSFCEAEFGYLKRNSEQKSGFAWIHDDTTQELIQQSKKKVDILIVQVHAGIENADIPIPEWRECYRKLCDAGASIIIGHHPHVPQGFEIYSGKYIFYSLGNFYFETSPLKTSGYIVSLNISNNKIAEVDTLPISYRDGVVSIHTRKSTITALSELLNKNYMEHVESLAQERWNKYYVYYYGVSLKSIFFISFLQKIIYLFYSFFVKDPTPHLNNHLLLHNIRIESHRWLSIRALEYICKKREL